MFLLLKIKQIFVNFWCCKNKMKRISAFKQDYFWFEIKNKDNYNTKPKKKHMMEFYNEIENTVLLHSFALGKKREKYNREDPFRWKSLFSYNSKEILI